MIERFELFATTIGQIYKNLQRIKMQEMNGLNLKGAHVMCLFQLHHAPEGLTVTQLSNLCHEDKAAISRTVTELTKRGLVSSDAKKKYRAPIQLTESGVAAASQIDEMVTEAVQTCGGDLTEEDRATFYRVLTQISDNLNHYHTEN